MTTAPRTLIVIPTFNEADNLERLTAEVVRTLPNADQLVVDDASSDGTATSPRGWLATSHG